MHMPEIQSVLNEKNISFSYVEEDNCGSIDLISDVTSVSFDSSPSCTV